MQFADPYSKLTEMTRPLALLLYEKVIPGGQLLNRLQDMNYRVHHVNKPDQFVAEAQREKPLLAVVDMEPQVRENCAAISKLRQNGDTSHIPVVAIAAVDKNDIQEAARAAGATLVVSDQAVLLHLDELLEQALRVD